MPVPMAQRPGPRFRNPPRPLSDDRTRRARPAALIAARCSDPARSPTIAIARTIARLFDVPASGFGAVKACPVGNCAPSA